MCSLSQHWTCFQQALFELPEAAFPAGLTPLHLRLMWLLDLVQVQSFLSGPGAQERGRPLADRRALLRAFLAKALFNFPTTEALLERLQVDRSLRRLCGWESRREVPSAATFSRAFREFAQGGLLDRMHAALVETHLADVLVFHVSRDSTAISARERPAKKEPPPPAPPKKRGGPPRDEPRRWSFDTRIQRQSRTPATQTDALFAELPTHCTYSTYKKKNGNGRFWQGYKLHTDVGDDGIPLLSVTTSGSLHDSQLAIPMARKTASRVTCLYELMDSAYDADEITAAIRDLDHVPIIAPKPRPHEPRPPLEPDRVRRLYHRSASERFHALLKDNHGGRTVRVRGHPKVHTHLMLGVVVIFAAILQGWAAR